MSVTYRGGGPAVAWPAIACVLLGRFVLPAPVQAAIVADSASDVCPPSPNPCLITSIVQVLPGAVLDFGTRTVSVVGGGQLDFGEACDRGVGNGLQGGACSVDCAFVGCGDPNDSHSYTASDALYILRAAVGSATCEPCVCDAVSPNGKAGITASDALAVLRKAVGIAIELTCAACAP